MTNARSGFSARYIGALRRRLGSAQTRGAESAPRLGRAALANGWEKRDVALLHGQAVSSFAASDEGIDAPRDWVTRAEIFLHQVLAPIETAQGTTPKTNRHLQQRHATLRLHLTALTRSNHRLQREVARRKAGEVAIRKGKEQYQRLFLESQIMQKKLRQMTRQIISAQEEERKEISRELHDEVVQTLVGINVQLSALSSGASAGLHTLKAKIARTQRLVESSVNAVHRFARELRPAVLDDLGLIPALHAYSKGLAARKKIKIHLTAFAGIETLGGAERTVLYRVAQEALTNVSRHAEADHVRINIREMAGAIRMEISDNGKSFHVEKTLLAKNHRRLGLIGMKERIEMVGGNFVIESTPGRGTTVRAEIPFHPAKAKK